LEILINIYHLDQTDLASKELFDRMNGSIDLSTHEAQLFYGDDLIVYHYIFMAAQVIQVIMVWTALISKNTLQLIGTCIFAYFLAAYTYIQSIHERVSENMK
jgi:hypothetical protein